MRIIPTPAGGLQIAAEEPGDWQLLKSITRDAVSCEQPLARRLGNLISDEAIARDWRDYVSPDLEAGFTSDLLHVATAVSTARAACGGAEPGTLRISPADAFAWYSALNQARLALEERFQFGAMNHQPPDLSGFAPAHRAALLRSQLYCWIQSALLDYAMG